MALILRLGLARQLSIIGPGVASGIIKPSEKEALVGPEGLVGDLQGDRRFHGGPEKAIHHYPAEHYAAWRQELPALATQLEPGSFGENISTVGLLEHDICIGDQYQMGEAVVEVSQGRQPCARLNWRFGLNGLARRVQESGRCGWYYRVLEPGSVSVGDPITRIARPHGDWPLTRLLEILYRRRASDAELRELLELPPLAESWKTLFRRRLETGNVEDMKGRLGED